LNVRDAKPSDIKDIANIQAESWQISYSGLVPEDFLKKMTPEKCEQRLAEVFGDIKETPRSFLVCEDLSEIVGFVVGGQNRFMDQTPDYDGELIAIYVKPNSLRSGYGKKMLIEIKKRLANTGYKKVIVRTLKANQKAINFYKKNDGLLVSDHLLRKLDKHTVIEVGYGWSLNKECC